MDNYDFLKKILMSTEEYWIVAKRNYGPQHRDAEDSIMMICIPMNVKRGLKYEEILLSDIENLLHTNVSNIFINEDFPPFQSGISFYNIYDGFPLKNNIKYFLIECLTAPVSNSLYDYKRLLEANFFEKMETELNTGKEL